MCVFINANELCCATEKTLHVVESPRLRVHLQVGGAQYFVCGVTQRVSILVSGASSNPHWCPVGKISHYFFLSTISLDDALHTKIWDG